MAVAASQRVGAGKAVQRIRVITTSKRVIADIAR